MSKAPDELPLVCAPFPFSGRPPGAKGRYAAGVEEVRKPFGDGAAAAAQQHIISDLKQEGWTEDQPFPRDEQEYVRMGLF